MVNKSSAENLMIHKLNHFKSHIISLCITLTKVQAGQYTASTRLSFKVSINPLCSLTAL